MCNHLQKITLIILIVINMMSCSSLDNSSKEKHLKGVRKSENPFVIRTDFSDDNLWKKLCSEIEKPDKKYGFKPYLDYEDNRKYRNSDPDYLKEVIRNNTLYPSLFFFVVDSLSLYSKEKLILCVSIDEDDKSNDRFRVVPGEMWVVENNLSTANLLFKEMFVSVDSTGIFRGQ